ncbi:hypothetical protein HanRHA438_Chr10g0456851 [Helianthus annuus]|nr:hypothetical protein HanIR_Chr10g0479311 [Helianthus annuus]KAJ0879904.1 hypothetical protein HanRHA438_Chr10g0456851 [Helianthus annuus]
MASTTTLIIFTLLAALFISGNLQTTSARRLLFFSIPGLSGTLPIPSLPPTPSLPLPPLPPFIPTLPNFPFPIGTPSGPSTTPPFARIFAPPIAGTIRH